MKSPGYDNFKGIFIPVSTFTILSTLHARLRKVEWLLRLSTKRGAHLQPKLVKDIDTLKFLFKNLKSFDDVACLLEVEKKTLWENVIAHKRYFDFEIPKKRSNEVRTINKPAKNLDIIQKNLITFFRMYMVNQVNLYMVLHLTEVLKLMLQHI